MRWLGRRFLFIDKKVIHLIPTMYLVFYKIHEDPIIRGDECTVNSTPVPAQPRSPTDLHHLPVNALHRRVFFFVEMTTKYNHYSRLCPTRLLCR
jgi:hypothetical protein